MALFKFLVINFCAVFSGSFIFSYLIWSGVGGGSRTFLHGPAAAIVASSQVTVLTALPFILLHYFLLKTSWTSNTKLIVSYLVFVVFFVLVQSTRTFVEFGRIILEGSMMGFLFAPMVALPFYVPLLILNLLLWNRIFGKKGTEQTND